MCAQVTNFTNSRWRKKYKCKYDANTMRTLKQSVVYKIHTSTRIPCYNNTLLRASEKVMKFGVNSDLIYHKPIVVPMHEVPSNRRQSLGKPQKTKR